MTDNEDWMSHYREGFLVSIEGVDGAGKSTQIGMLDRWMKAKGIAHTILKEPTSGPFGREIVHKVTSHEPITPEEEARLFMKDRKEDVTKNILPALHSGKIVVMDRYYHSNMAYQGARGLDPEKIREENEKFAPRPDLVIVLDIDPEKSLLRIVDHRKSPLDAFEKEDYLRRVREVFLKIGDQPNGVIIDASEPAEKVHEAIIHAIMLKLPPHMFNHL